MQVATHGWHDAPVRALWTPASPQAVVVSCPAEDLAGIGEVLARRQVALMPVGGVGDLGLAAGIADLLIIEVTDDGPRPAITWRAALGSTTPLDVDLRELLPTSWLQRHPGAYERSREPTAHEPPTGDLAWEDADDDPAPVQLFVPLSALEPLPHDCWLFTNELVPKQRRGGRWFAPATPVVVPAPAH